MTMVYAFEAKAGRSSAALADVGFALSVAGPNFCSHKSRAIVSVSSILFAEIVREGPANKRPIKS
jgi:hypothetical protein